MRAAAWACALASLLASAAPPAHESPSVGSDCAAGLPITLVEGATASEKDSACRGVERAAAFFAAHLRPPRLDAPAITVRFVDESRLPCMDPQLPAGCSGPRVAAQFDAARNLVEMTRARQPWMSSEARPYFTLPFDRALYDSVLVHEATHAISKQFYRYEPDERAQDEYVAYASQIWSLSPELRARVVAAYPDVADVGRADEGGFNDMVHFFNPHKFGARSWSHFVGPAGGRAFLERLYSGDFRPPTLE